MNKVSNQLIAEIRRRAEELDRLLHGEVVLKVQDGKDVWGEVLKTWKADWNKREARV